MSDDYTDERFRRVYDRFDAMMEAAQQRATAQDAALVKAEDSLKAYKATANEFRGALADQAALLLPRQEYSTQYSALVEKFNRLDAQMLRSAAANEGRQTGISRIGYIIVSSIGGLVGLASIASVLVTLLHTPVPPQEITDKIEKNSVLIERMLRHIDQSLQK